MFVEKLTREEIVDFYIKNVYEKVLKTSEKLGVGYYANSYSPENIKKYKVEDGVVSFEVSDLVIKISDFEFEKAEEFERPVYLDLDWIKFMKSKFGDEYVDAFKAHRERTKKIVVKQILEDFVRDYDKTTNNYLNALKDNDLEK